MQKALKTVRDEMGPDAVILSNHRVNGGVEIIVAQNYEPVSAKKTAPVFHDDDLEELDEKKAQPTLNKPKNDNPWPFLNANERHDVEEQLKLQDQLEALKRQREKEHGPVGQAKESTASMSVQSKSDLQQSLEQIKQQRQDPSYAYQPPESAASLKNHDKQDAVKSQYNQQILNDVRNELNDLKDLLVNHSSSAPVQQSNNFVWKKFSPSNALQAKLWQRLEQMGFDDWIIYLFIYNLFK